MWARARARASSGRGRASQRYLGSSRLGARVWGRRGKVWRVGSNYQCCWECLQREGSRAPAAAQRAPHHALRRHQRRSPLLLLTDERRAAPSQRRQVRTGRRQARADSSSAAKTQLPRTDTGDDQTTQAGSIKSPPLLGLRAADPTVKHKSNWVCARRHSIDQTTDTRLVPSLPSLESLSQG